MFLGEEKKKNISFKDVKDIYILLDFYSAYSQSSMTTILLPITMRIYDVDQKSRSHMIDDLEGDRPPSINMVYRCGHSISFILSLHWLSNLGRHASK
jgi:hypothetical protein